MSDVGRYSVNVGALFAQKLPELAQAKDKMLVQHQGSAYREIKLGESAKAGKLAFNKLSDEPKKYGDCTHGPSDRAYEITARNAAVTNKVSALAAGALGNTIREAIGETLTQAQETAITAKVSGFQDDMREVVGKLVYKGKPSDSKSGLTPTTVGDLKDAINETSGIASARVTRDIKEIRQIGRNEAEGVQRSVVQQRSPGDAQALKRFDRLNKYGAASDFRGGWEGVLKKRQAKKDAATTAHKAGERLRAKLRSKLGDLQNEDELISGFQSRVETKVTEFLSAAKGHDHASLEREASDLADRMVQAQVGSTAREAAPVIARRKADEAVQKLTTQLGRLPGRVGFTESKLRDDLKAKVKADVERLTTGILLADNGAEIESVVTTSVAEAVALFKSARGS